ncbi:MAG: AAA family ATPase [Anaerolineae bacterium]
MAKLSKAEQLRILADLVTSAGTPSCVDLEALDPLAFDETWMRAIILAAKAGVHPQRDILPILASPEQALLLGVDPSAGGSMPCTWEDMARQLGPVSWSWPSWLPNGFLTMAVAEQAAGKSALALRVAASFVTGLPWPDGTDFVGTPGKVVWAEAEGSQALNLQRAGEWGMPPDRILSPLGGPEDDFHLQNPNHMAALVDLAHREDVRFIVLDSLSGSNTVSENEAAMIHVVKPLGNLARDTGKPFLVTHHLRKRGPLDGGAICLDRVRGAGAITQPVRVVWAVDVPDRREGACRRLSVIKNNLKSLESLDPIGFRLTDSGIIFGDAPKVSRTEKLTERAQALLLSLLKNGPMLAKQVEEELAKEGISGDTASKAKLRLGITSERIKNAWWWSLPTDEGGEGSS